MFPAASPCLLCLICLFYIPVLVNSECSVELRDVTIVDFVFERNNVTNALQNVSLRVRENYTISYTYDLGNELLGNITSVQPTNFTTEGPLVPLSETEAQFNATGMYLFPAFVDSNARLSGLTEDQLNSAVAGLSAAVDLQSDTNFLSATLEPIQGVVMNNDNLLRSGPLLVPIETPEDTTGTRIPVNTTDAATTVQSLINAGADLIHAAMAVGTLTMDQATIDAIVTAAGNRTVAVQALLDSTAGMALQAGAQVLSALPSSLTGGNLNGWANRTVISSVGERTDMSIEVGRNLFELGGTILYGTGTQVTTGSEGTTGISELEILSLLQVFDNASSPHEEVLWAGIAWPVVQWGLDQSPGLGSLEEGKVPSFIISAVNPLDDIRAALFSGETRAFFDGPQANCEGDACWSCLVDDDDINDEVQIVVGLVVPVAFGTLVYLLCTLGLLYHFCIRKRKKGEEAWEEAEAFEMSDEDYFSESD